MADCFTWVGPLLGAVIGGLASLGGTVLTQREINRREEKHRQEASHERRINELRTAYAEFLCANQKGIMLLSSTAALRADPKTS